MKDKNKSSKKGDDDVNHMIVLIYRNGTSTEITTSPNLLENAWKKVCLLCVSGEWIKTALDFILVVE